MGWKIVRDRDDVVCPAMGITGQWRESAEPIAGLIKKLHEELGEFVEKEDVAELYQLMDVCAELLDRLDPGGTVAAAHGAVVAVRGKFSRCLEWTPERGIRSDTVGP